MCRLFGLHAGPAPVSATFWLLNAPDSLREQSHRNPDGAGIGVFEDPAGPGQPRVFKAPIAAWQDREFATDAKRLRGTTFVAHVRYASTGAHTMANTHPFVQSDRLFAHNGVVQGLDILERRLAELAVAPTVNGDTDSERVFALITAHTELNGGDVTAGIVEAVSWIARELPLYAVNIVLATANDLWALRYPDTHDLFLLERPAGGADTAQHLDVRSHRIRAHSPDLAQVPSVLVATERMDADPGWQPLGPGELIHVGPDLTIDRSTPLPRPARLLTVQDLSPTEAQSQHPAGH